MEFLADIYEEENNIDSMNLCNKYYETYFKLQENRQRDNLQLTEQYDKYKIELKAKLDTLRKQKNKQKKNYSHFHHHSCSLISIIYIYFQQKAI